MRYLPQVKDVIYHCDIWTEPKFIDHHLFKEITFEPIIASPVLYKKAKKTDLIDAESVGFSLKLLMSTKLKKLVTFSIHDNFEFFNNPLYQDGNIDENYWILNPTKSSINKIDFSYSNIYLLKHYSQKVEKLKVANFEDFNKNFNNVDQMGYPFSILIEKFKFIEGMIEKEELLVLDNIEGGVGYFVSDILKNKIEEAGCTGIEFQPSELSYNEWLMRDGPRDQVYGRSW